MSRPEEFENLTTTTITIPKIHKKKIKGSKINLSKFVRDKLNEEFGLEEGDYRKYRVEKLEGKLENVPEDKIKSMKKIIKEEPGKARGWKRKLDNIYGIKVTEQELKDFVR